MDPKDIHLLETIRRSPESSLEELVAMLMRMYGYAIRKDIDFHSHIGLIPPEEHGHVEPLIIQEFVELVRNMGGELPEGLTVRQLLHLVTVQVALRLYSDSVSKEDAAEDSIYYLGSRGSQPRSNWLTSLSPVGILRRARGGNVVGRQTISIKTEERMTPGFLSSGVIPYITAIADVQRVCNAVLKRPQREVSIKSISQNSPMSIKLIDAAQAINAVKEDIIPWRRKNAQNLAILKEVDVAADIKKKEEEALEIRARATKDQAEAEKIKAEAAKIREEAEQMRIENDKRRFELQKAKFELALEIVSKMQPDLPPSDKYVFAMQLLPAIDTLSTSPIEPSRLLA